MLDPALDNWCIIGNQTSGPYRRMQMALQIILLRPIRIWALVDSWRNRDQDYWLVCISHEQLPKLACSNPGEFIIFKIENSGIIWV